MNIITTQNLKNTFLQEQMQYKPLITKCLHLICPDCNGTGLKSNGQSCVHMISCSCSRCSPKC